MSSINKLAAYLQPKSATAAYKFGINRQPTRNTAHFCIHFTIPEAA